MLSPSGISGAPWPQQATDSQQSASVLTRREIRHRGRGNAPAQVAAAAIAE
jgi:hypothetical protein